MDRAIVTGGALDQPSLHKFFFLFGYSSTVLCTFVLIVRWLSNRKDSVVRVIFGALTLIVMVHPLSILTLTVYDLIRYINAMGPTPMRLLGLVLGLGGYAFMFLFLAWALGLLRRIRRHREIPV